MIPRIIHQMWIGPPLPELYEDYIQSWRQHHPKWQHWLWSAMPLDLENQDLWDEAEDISPRSPWQFRSDVARYEILWRYGGVWADADFLCQKPLDDLMDEPWVVKHAGRWVANGIIAVTPGHPAMREAIDGLAMNVMANLKRANTWKSGPRYFTPIARRHRMRELPAHYFLPYEWNELHRANQSFPDSYAVHRWANQRRKKGMAP